MVIMTTYTYSKPYTELGMVQAVVAAGRFLKIKSMEQQLEAEVQEAQDDLEIKAT